MRGGQPEGLRSQEVVHVPREDLQLSRRELMGSSAVAAGAVLAGSMVGGAMAQSGPTDEISGTVTDVDGNAVDGATVVAVPHDEALDALVTTTDSMGAYTFDNGDLHGGENLYHVVARDGTEADPQRSQENYPFIAAEGMEIPDSEDLHARYDATEISASDSDPVSTWSDETGNGHDLTAGTSPTYIASGINGNPVVRFDGADDFLDVAWSVLSQPNHVFMAGQLQSVPGSSSTFLDSESASDRNALFKSGQSGDPWALHAGSTITGGSADTSAHIFNALFNGSSSELRLDGSSTITGNPGSQGLDGVTVGSEVEQNNYAPIDIGEILIYPQDKSGVQGDVESYLSDKWGITL